MYSVLRFGEPQQFPLSHVFWLSAYWLCNVAAVSAALVVPMIVGGMLSEHATRCDPCPAGPQQALGHRATITGAWWCVVILRSIALWFAAGVCLELVGVAQVKVEGLSHSLIPEYSENPPWTPDLFGSLWRLASQHLSAAMFASILWFTAPMLGRLAAGRLFSGCRCCGYGSGGEVPSPCPECGDHSK